MKTRKSTLDTPALWLCLGVLWTVGSQMRWGWSALAWVAAVPYLRYLRLTRGVASRGAFVGAYLLGWVLATAKIITGPLPWMLAALFGVLIGGILVWGYLLWDVLQRRVEAHWAGLGFAAAMVCLEWLQHSLTPLASWGAAAYTQIGNRALLQSLSLFGMAGVGFLVYWVGASIEWAWWKKAFWVRHHGVLLGICVAVYGFGMLRLSWAERRGERGVRLAAVGTDATFGGLPLPSARRIAKINQELFARTRRAASLGARMVVWNEGATLLRSPSKEKAWRRELSALARTSKVALVAAYIMPISTKPLRYENKYLWFRPDGSLAQSYLKHKPVLGEPAVAGRGPSQAIDAGFGKVAGAICYDYDYPRLALAHSRQGIGLAVVPSSDWKGIDPIHTHMASFRAIEGGFSLLRSTRFGLSAGIDPYGRVRAWQSAFDEHDKIMWVSLPVASVPTLYAQIGDAFLALCALGLLALLWRCRRPLPALDFEGRRALAQIHGPR